MFSRKTVVHGGAIIPHPFGISLFEHTVYFTDWTKMAVLKANKFTDNSPQVVYRTSQTPHGVAVIHQLKQPQGTLHCGLNKCNIYLNIYKTWTKPTKQRSVTIQHTVQWLVFFCLRQCQTRAM